MGSWSGHLTIKVLVIWTVLPKKVLKYTFSKAQILPFLISSTQLFIHKTQITDGDCSVFIVIVSVGFSKHFNRLIVMFYCLIEFFQTFLTICQISQTFSHLHIKPSFQSVLFYNQRTLIWLFSLCELSFVKINVSQCH